jgi:hypothetical protein
MPDEIWICDTCGHEKDREQEVRCWECSDGEMIYQGKTDAKQST